jgi:(1->4)-alpha-D-glucan 1-alpha-D-glucosylmutase
LRYPVATYRLQLNKDFPFDKAIELLPFLHKLGISDVYASPVFHARRGSVHGYDVVDPSHANPELGGDEGFNALCEALRAHGMGLVLDIVPNHMAASSENAWWTDVLESGPSSAYAAFFDVEWDAAWEQGEEKIFLPILGAPYGTALENQEISLSIGPDGFSINYYQIHLPVDPGTYEIVLEHGREHWPENEEFQALIKSIERLPDRTALMWEGIEARRREIPSIKSQLWSMYQSNAEVRSFVDASIAEFNGGKGDPASFDLLDQLTARQSYRLAWWHGARERMNYRRFFDVSELIGMRVESDEVFAATHAAVLKWVAEGKVTGVRVDHVDGLFKPREYLERLAAIEQRPYIVVEKILIEDEQLPEDWPIQGTSGYDFLGMVNGVFIDGASLEALQATYSRFTGLNWTFEDAAYEQKRWIIRHLFRGEMFALSLHLELIADLDRYGRDLSPQELRNGLAEITACLPVYRTYVEGESMHESDRRYIEAAITEARRRGNAEISSGVYDFLRRVLLAEFSRGLTEEGRQAWIRFVMRWQQLTGPITAKGVEDTAMYVYNRLVSMNDVGTQHTAVSLERFHHFNAARQRRWPAAMSATSTHDTKRSEDVRARLNVLSELVSEWDRNIFRWSRWNRDRKTTLDGRPVPDANEEILLYQTLLGVWPLDEGQIPSTVDRVKQYIVKATREAKVYSSWLRPNEIHEKAIHEFIDAILEAKDGNRFLPHFTEFQHRVAFFGALNSLGQVLLKITAPGVPDFYQNTALWDFSLVDPDNRRGMDPGARLLLSGEMDRWTAAEVLENWKDGRVKAFLIHRALQYRCTHPELFIGGDYLPVEAEGSLRDSVIAFVRRLGGDVCLTVAPRFTTRLGGTDQIPLGRRAWKDTSLRLPEEFAGEWMDAITGERTRSMGLSEILSTFPVALLSRQL